MLHFVNAPLLSQKGVLEWAFDCEDGIDGCIYDNL